VRSFVLLVLASAAALARLAPFAEARSAGLNTFPAESTHPGYWFRISARDLARFGTCILKARQ
jgi:hypothetical protein